MTLVELLPILVAVGFGGILTTVINFFLTKNRFREEKLYDARRQVYARLLGQGRITVILIDSLSPKFFPDSGPTMQELKLNKEIEKCHHIFSEGILLAESDLRELLINYINLLTDFRLNKTSERKKLLIEFIGVIEDTMRGELFIKSSHEKS